MISSFRGNVVVGLLIVGLSSTHSPGAAETPSLSLGAHRRSEGWKFAARIATPRMPTDALTT